jgi:hypothetical protein
MKKTMLVFILLFSSIILFSCDISTTKSTTSTSVTTDSTSESTLFMTLNPEDENLETITTDETVIFSVTNTSSLNDQVLIDGGVVTINHAGTYLFEGSSSDAMIIVDVSSNEQVTLVLNGVDLTSQSGAVINVINADKVIITLGDGTVNQLTDSSSSSEHSAVVQSNDDLTINGYGTLIINALLNNGISVDDDLVIVSGEIQVNALNNAIKVHNDCMIYDGILTLTSGNDGIQVENLDDSTLGNIVIQDGVFQILAYGDGFDANNVIAIYGGTYSISSGVNNSNITLVSGKGVKATNGINIMGGTFVVISKDDGFHANSDFYIQGGSLTITTNDDGIHADNTLTISGGEINILKSYEGIESYSVIINDGNIHIISSDDGINCAGGADTSSNFPWGKPNQDNSGTATLEINGGYININAGGDGLDVNGLITMNGGTVLVCGPTSSNDGAIDYNVCFALNGGTLIAVGSAGMAQNASTSSTQASVLIGLSSSTTSSLTLIDSDGNVICHFEPTKKYQTIVISSPNLSLKTNYKLYLGGNITNADEITDGYCVGCTYITGSLSQSFTLAQKISSVGTSSTMPRH